MAEEKTDSRFKGELQVWEQHISISPPDTWLLQLKAQPGECFSRHGASPRTAPSWLVSHGKGGPPRDGVCGRCLLPQVSETFSQPCHKLYQIVLLNPSWRFWASQLGFWALGSVSAARSESCAIPGAGSLRTTGRLCLTPRPWGRSRSTASRPSSRRP